MSRTDTAARRLDALRHYLDEYELDAVLLTSRENNRYFGGFTGTESFLVISAERAVIFVDFRYTEQAAAECTGCEVIDNTPDRLGSLIRFFESNTVIRLGVEENQLSWQLSRDLQFALATLELSAAETWLGDLRSVKDEGEIAKIQHAVQIAERSLLEILPEIRIGRTENEIAARLENAMRMHGASGPSFATIVASGPRSALPHGVASDRAIQRGDVIVMDFGCVWQGYCSDMTRTVFMGEPASLERQIYAVVLEAQQKSAAAVRAGMTGREADQIARSLIADAGYGREFGHGLGHGVGLAIHESPRLSRTYEKPLLAGQIVSVEPGIYLPGQFGVRIEDLVLVEAGGARNLNTSGKELLVLPA